MKLSYFIVWLTLGLQCVVDNAIDKDYFDNLANLTTGEKPSQPILQPLNYPTNTDLTWSVSIDPETGKNVSLYFVYYYVSAIPNNAQLYNQDNLLPVYGNVKDATTLSLSNLIFPKGVYFIGVSGYDGGRESLLSNIVSFEVK